MELACALAPFWLADGAINEGGTRLEAALASAHGDLRADVLRQTASFAFRRGDYPLALARMQESTDMKRAAGDERGMGGRLNLLGNPGCCATRRSAASGRPRHRPTGPGAPRCAG